MCDTVLKNISVKKCVLKNIRVKKCVLKKYSCYKIFVLKNGSPEKRTLKLNFWDL